MLQRNYFRNIVWQSKSIIKLFILVIYHYISVISYYISGGIFMDYKIVVDAGHGGIG